MSNITTLERAEPEKPPVCNPDLYRATLAAMNGTGLVPSAHAAAQARLSILKRSLDHRDRAATTRAIMAMLAGFPSASGRMGDDDARMTVAAYVAAVSNLPPWAVVEAAKRWSQGVGGATASAFPPSSAQLHDLAREIVRRFEVERAQMERAIGVVAAEPGAAERERVSKGFDELRSLFGARAEATEQAQREAALSSLEARAAELGIDAKAALASIPDAPEHLGKWGKLSGAAVR